MPAARAQSVGAEIFAPERHDTETGTDAINLKPVGSNKTVRRIKIVVLNCLIDIDNYRPSLSLG